VTFRCQGSYSRKQVVRTIEQRSYDLRRNVRYDVFTERVANGNRIVRTICLVNSNGWSHTHFIRSSYHRPPFTTFRE